MSELKDLFGFLCMGFIIFILVTNCTPLFIFFIAAFLFIFLVAYGAGMNFNNDDTKDDKDV